MQGQHRNTNAISKRNALNLANYQRSARAYSKCICGITSFACCKDKQSLQMVSFYRLLSKYIYTFAHIPAFKNTINNKSPFGKMSFRHSQSGKELFFLRIASGKKTHTPSSFLKSQRTVLSPKHFLRQHWLSY